MTGEVGLVEIVWVVMENFYAYNFRTNRFM